MSDKFGSVLIILVFGVNDDILIEPETHKISVLKTYIGSLIFSTHSYTADFIFSLLAD
jgi:hypothetical protein